MRPNSKPAPARLPRLAPVEMWRLVSPDGHVQTCELLDDSANGAGFEMLVPEDGAQLFGRGCLSEQMARFAAEAMGQDSLQTGLRVPDSSE